MRRILIIIALLVTCAQAQEAKTDDAASATAPTVRTASGIVRGVTDGDVSSFKGIPYAAAPIGDYRWRPPQAPATWQAVRDASKFGADCAQAGFGRGNASISPNSSEDCLFVNVWRPAAAEPGAKLPVMVWIHGGAFVFGSGSSPGTSGVSFARQGVILVTFNYRLGRLGFFAFPALSRSGLPQWPRYDPAKDEIIEFRPDGTAAGEPDPRKARLDVTEAAAKPATAR